MLIILLIGVGYVGRWFLNTYTARVDRKYAELLREIAEIKVEDIKKKSSKKKLVKAMKTDKNINIYKVKNINEYG